MGCSTVSLMANDHHKPLTGRELV